MLIVEFQETESSVLDEILSILQKHESFKRYELQEEKALSIPGLEIRPSIRKVYVGKQVIELTAKEYDLICLLVVNKIGCLHTVKYMILYGEIFRQAMSAR